MGTEPYIITETVRTDATPEAAYYPFRNGAPSAFLNSSLGTDAGRYSYIGIDPFITVSSRGRSVQTCSPEGKRSFDADPFDALSLIISAYKTRTATSSPFAAGGIGYFAYELKNLLEDLPKKAEDDLKLPEMFFAFYRTIVAFDRAKPGKAEISRLLVEEDRTKAEAEISSVKNMIAEARLPESAVKERAGGIRSNFTKKEYLGAVERVLEHIRAGNIYQACLTQRFEADWPGHPYDLYTELNSLSPAPFSAYLNCGDFSVISSSPELFLKMENGLVETRPMKGTRPRGFTPEDDLSKRAELLESGKDAAELVMIVDLERNDLGKTCKPGSIKVSELRRIEEYPAVYQTISVIKGELRDGMSAIDAVKAAFPGGSITGCPKIRSMEILDELEPSARGICMGALGYISLHGTMELNIAIRTMVHKARKVYFHAGGGIVADSDPEKEYEETLVKARAMMQILGHDEQRTMNNELRTTPAPVSSVSRP